jgi:hypothetical protein
MFKVVPSYRPVTRLHTTLNFKHGNVEHGFAAEVCDARDDHLCFLCWSPKEKAMDYSDEKKILQNGFSFFVLKSNDYK